MSGVEYDLTDFTQRQERERERRHELAMQQSREKIARIENRQFQSERTARIVTVFVAVGFLGIVGCTAHLHDPANEQQRAKIEQQREVFCIEKGGEWIPDVWAGDAAHCNMPSK